MQDRILEIHQEIFIARTPTQLWDFFMNQEGLKQWFNAKVFEVDVFEGGELKFDITRGGQPYRISGETGLLQENKKLVFTWIEQNQWGQKWFAPTNVSFFLNPTTNGSQFVVLHTGFKYLPENIQEETGQQYKHFWAEDALPRLKKIVEEGPASSTP